MKCFITTISVDRRKSPTTNAVISWAAKTIHGYERSFHTECFLTFPDCIIGSWRIGLVALDKLTIVFFRLAFPLVEWKIAGNFLLMIWIKNSICGAARLVLHAFQTCLILIFSFRALRPTSGKCRAIKAWWRPRSRKSGATMILVIRVKNLCTLEAMLRAPKKSQILVIN